MDCLLEGTQYGTRQVSFVADPKGRTVTMELMGTDEMPPETFTLNEAEVKALLHELAAKKWVQAPAKASQEERDTAMAKASAFEDNHE